MSKNVNPGGEVDTSSSAELEDVESQNSTTMSRRKLLATTATAGVAGASAGCLGEDESNQYLPGIDRESFQRTVDELFSHGNQAEKAASEASEEFQERGFSLDASDYRGRGLEVTDSVRVAVPADSQSQTIQAEQNGDSREFQWLDGTKPMDQSLEELVDEIDSEVGLSDQDRTEIANDELLEVATNMVPYVRSGLNEDGSDGQPQLGDEELGEYKQFMKDVKAAEQAYSQAVSELSDSVRELEQQQHVIENEETEQISGILSGVPFIGGSSGYNKDQHFTEKEASDLAKKIEKKEGSVQKAYGQALSEYVVAKALRHSGEQVAEQLGIAQGIYEGGEFDEAGRPADSEYDGGDADPGAYDELFEGCDGLAPGEKENAVNHLEGKEYEPGELEASVTDNGALEVTSEDGQYSQIFNCKE